MNTHEFPLVVRAPSEGASLPDFLAGRKERMEADLAEYGAVLYRGFAPMTGEALDRLVGSLSSVSFKNDEESSPRNHVVGNVYTSTNYRSEMEIFPHNENSYKKEFPMKLFFYCVHPGAEGGETPIADCRRVLKRLGDGIKAKFQQKKWMYVRNFTAGIGVSWQEAFNTTRREDVEAYCRDQDIRFAWHDEDSLKTWQVREPLLSHPASGEPSWFNHATFFNIQTLDKDLRESLCDMFGDDALPHNTYYGDGSPIEPAVIGELQQAYLAESVPIKWETGDLMVLDNLLTAHARKPFKGERRIYLAQTDPVDRATLVPTEA
ncbi:TauD/TfdA family dioxygenase [Tahibacter amnicola]|uniref:TauD/TfdA family dioxygenase n=1 Tax=Tahibacter amnicola TaxID=2976241 RepID=A0ABY6B970_9GAMM|nr:TauD/TfdA family dioxygenase [Tahibacter amnicola]UXI66219.1 TauD/TfdA family dioxygenase [Tahibacter amnicola]